MVPDDRLYSSEHEWAKAEGDEVVVGITDFAQAQLGDVVYIELPKVGDHVKQMEVMGVIESVKTASDLYSPISGEVIAVNEDAVSEPQKVNEAPYSAGWLIRVRAENPAELNNLMSAEAYEAHIAEAGGGH